MRLSSAATVGILLGLALILPGCGEEQAATATPERGAAPARAAGKTRTAEARCRGRLHDLLDSMDALREKLAVGLSYEGYLHDVREARFVYRGIRADRLAIGCLTTVGTPAERALNRYIDAANTWGDCLAVASCDTESIEPKLQRSWARASDLLSEAQTRAT
jgi:hypothetical protein